MPTPTKMSVETAAARERTAEETFRAKGAEAEATRAEGALGSGGVCCTEGEVLQLVGEVREEEHGDLHDAYHEDHIAEADDDNLSQDGGPIPLREAVEDIGDLLGEAQLPLGGQHDIPQDLDAHDLIDEGED